MKFQSFSKFLTFHVTIFPDELVIKLLTHQDKESIDRIFYSDYGTSITRRELFGILPKFQTLIISKKLEETSKWAKNHNLLWKITQSMNKKKIITRTEVSSLWKP